MSVEVDHVTVFPTADTTPAKSLAGEDGVP
jgi:hypothetical protein